MSRKKGLIVRMAKKGNFKKCKNWSGLGFFVVDRYGLDEKNIWSRTE